MHIAVLVALISLPVASRAQAQQPFVVDDAEVVPRRTWQLETNFEWDSLRTGLRPDVHQSVLDLEIGYGLAPRLEISALVQFIALARATGAADASGLGDASLGAKFRITREPTARHAFAVSLGVELPTGSHRRGLGSSLTDLGLSLGWQYRLSPALTVRANGGAVLAGNTQTGALGLRERGAVLTAGSSLTALLSRRVLLGAEVVGAWSERSTIGGSYVQWQVGGNVILHPRASLDWGLIHGHADVSPALGVQVGCTVAFGGP